ncbi:MAG: protein hit [Chloroflexi bacterium]|jgi:histidine triad (HIT) family protein|nr:protein hit [Chloroflexota bacterium]
MSGVLADCLFCRIIQGTLPSAKVYEDDKVVAFMNLQQKNPGHTLIVPKDHYRNIYDIEEDAAAEIARVAVRLAKAIKTAFEPDGMNTLQNSEPAAMQSIFHYHLHLIPRYYGDDLFAIFSSPGASPDELNANAEKIKAAL